MRPIHGCVVTFPQHCLRAKKKTNADIEYALQAGSIFWHQIKEYFPLTVADREGRAGERGGVPGRQLDKGAEW